MAGLIVGLKSSKFLRQKVISKLWTFVIPIFITLMFLTILVIQFGDRYQYKRGFEKSSVVLDEKGRGMLNSLKDSSIKVQTFTQSADDATSKDITEETVQQWGSYLKEVFKYLDSMFDFFIRVYGSKGLSFW